MNRTAKDIIDFAMKYTKRDACKCGQCIDAGADAALTVDEHNADMVFFKVSKDSHDGKMPTKEEFLELLGEHKGVFCDVNPLDGDEHGYMELGGFFGDQQQALLIMGLGKLLGVWELLTPKNMLKGLVDDAAAMQLAQHGMVTIRSEKKGAATA